MQRASLQQLVAWVIAQVDGRQLGHSNADECDSSQARFVVSSRANKAETEIKGDQNLPFMKLHVGLYNKKNKVVSTYSLGYQSVSKGKSHW